MKKAISISFLIVFLLGNTELHEVLKIPFLFEHYLLHKKNEKTQSFVTFLYLHYASGQEHEHQQNEHENLPLKTKDCIKFNPTMVLFSFLPQSSISEDLFHLKRAIRFKKIFLSNLNKGSIWQPPQIS
ncbi:MAG: hypothetical protein RLZZ417_636 [Bacteroidota bacterium]|jgi:hypothetical protein